MAETIVFKVPTYITYSDTITGASWFQSDDGETWDNTPVDSIAMSALPLDQSGKFIWDSLLANSERYHLIKFTSMNNIVSSDTLFLPPKPQYIKNAVSGILISDVQSYALGESVELILRVDDIGISVIGNYTDVTIADEFGNVITTLVAKRIGSIYVASWTVPLNLKDYYNQANLPESNSENFILTDSWNLYGNTISYSFFVDKNLESPTSENSVIQIAFGDIADSDGNSLAPTNTIFATKLTPCYTSTNDVRDVNRDLLSSYNDFTIARHIINYSKVVDLMMRPKIIYYQDIFDHAVRNFVKLKAAKTLLLSVAQLNEEEKSLDTFRYHSSSATPKDLLEPIEEQAKSFALFIYAGGKDTPFVSKNFEKGVFDPNRPKLTRSTFDNSGWFPWLNSASSAFSVQVDGQTMEIRGERCISYSYIMSRFLNSDLGDVGYLSGI